MDRAAVRVQLAGDEIEQRGLTGTVRADDQAAFARFDRKAHVIGDAQPAEGLAQCADRERCHGLICVIDAGCTRLSRRHNERDSRIVPGTKPSGMNTTIATKIAPSMKFHRWIYALTTFLMMTTRAAPTTGPSRVPAPPEMTINSASAEA